MYLPSDFIETDRSLSVWIMRENSFASIVSPGEPPIVSSLPVLVNASGEAVTLRFHLALRNPHCERLTEGSSSMAVFTGPNCYVSPTWYDEHPSVPTWNYVSVQALGTIA